jgi:hypothetical protein
MTIKNISHPEMVVEHGRIERLAGLQFLLHYALSHAHARSWLAPLTRLLRHGRAWGEMRDG